jgi:hypothetical protein
MSSQPGNDPSKAHASRRGFEPWRKWMLAGALLLLGRSLLEALTSVEIAAWLVFISNFIGWGLLSAGFVMALRTRAAKHGSQSDTKQAD